MTADADIEETSLDETIVERVAAVLEDAERAIRPIEVDPYRARLFETFVTAEGAGFLADDAEFDLKADGLCRRLGERWGLADASRESAEKQQKLAPEHVAKMRLLWSLLRMWMEWTYAWERWPEFHES
ncbi:MAG: hypothetical protein H0T47_03855 [Planctomycetaceae bacterium]|nr:hypothetical protein [Planctomycetaceae bacterium]